MHYPCSPSLVAGLFLTTSTMTTLAFTTTRMLPTHHRSSSSMRSASSPQDYLNKAEQIRAEIAALEGKTLTQVQDEAKEKKTREHKARELQKTAAATSEPRNIRQFGRALEIPTTQTDMVIQAARAVERAVADGILRQTVRLALVEDDEQSIYDSADNMWPGGAVQMSRESAKPLGTELLRNLRFDGANDSYRTTNVKVQDIWDFDGSALLSTETVRNTTALVFANTDVKYTNDIQTLDETAGENDLLLLINPFWRNIESWGFNLLAPGAKDKAQQVIFDRGFDTETYVCMRFRCRGEECIAIKAYPYDWQIYAYLEASYSPIRLGESENEPKSDMVTELLNERPEFKLSKTMRQMQR